MQWTDFLFIYTAAAALLLLTFRRLLAGEWRRLARTVVCVTLLMFFADYIAEDRAFWSFGRTMGVEVLEVPLENSLFGSATAAMVILLYRRLDGVSR